MRQTGYGINDNVQQQIDRTHAASRTSVRPPEKGAFGAYSIALVSGVMAAGLAAGSPIYAFRWTSNSVSALVRRVRLLAGTDATAFAQGATIFDLIRATNFAVQDTSGATVTIAGKSGAKTQRYPASQIQIAASATGNIAIANTATLTAGTRTLDSNPLGIIVGSVGAVPANFPVPNGAGYLWEQANPAQEPLELGQNEGFVIRATVPATGTWRFGVEVDYDEVDPARYFALMG
jgi:hypothetical protein